MEQLSNSQELAKAPGCYAAPSVFSHDSEVCAACPAFTPCADACISTLKELRDRINIDDILARHRSIRASIANKAAPAKVNIGKFLPSAKVPTDKVDQAPKAKEVKCDVAPDQQVILDGLKEKPRALAAKWCRDGMIERIHADLLQGVNSFASQARQNFEYVTCDLLINGAVTKTSLKKAFMARLGIKKPWDEATAASHVNIALQALQGFGIIVENSEGYVVAPKAGSDNV